MKYEMSVNGLAWFPYEPDAIERKFMNTKNTNCITYQREMRHPESNELLYLDTVEIRRMNDGD